MAIPPEAPGKQTFGDLDVMVCRPIDLHPHDAILQICSRGLGSRCKKFIYALPTTNIAITSDDSVAQVDVHIVPEEKIWGVDYWMHSWGDMGMIVSSMIRAWGLRLSASRGLWVDVPGLGIFELSLDMERITLFLGLNWEIYTLGFQSQDDLFAWIDTIIINGRRIGVKKQGKLEKGEHQNRPMWSAYWQRGTDETYSPSDEEKQAVFQQALDFFGKRQEFEDTVALLERNRIAKEKFNGNRVSEWTGAEGRRLGILMKTLRADCRLSPASVINISDEEIKSIVMESWRTLA